MMGKGPCLLGASLAVGWFVRRWRPSNHTRSPSSYLGVSLCLTHDCCTLIISSWVRCLAILNWSSLSATCGIGDGLSIQSACVLNPYNMKKGNCPVVLLGQLLCTNSARGRYACQLSCHSSTQNCRYCSSHWFVHSDCPSALGWYAVEMFCVVPIPLHIPLMNLEVNFGSLSLMNFSGSLNCGKMCWTISPAVSSAIMLSRHGMNIAALVQSWSVTVSIESYPCEIGSLVMKSRATVSNGIASRVGNIGNSVTPQPALSCGMRDVFVQERSLIRTSVR